MASLTFKIEFSKNEGLVMSPSELLSTYFFGIDIRDSQGNNIPRETIKTYIEAAQDEVEEYFNLKFKPQIIEEEKSFYLNDFHKWSYIRTTYLVRKAFAVSGLLNSIPQIEYPSEWLSIKESNLEDYHRQIHIIPNQGGNATISGVVFSGNAPYLGIRASQNIPNYWRCCYATGFTNVPKALLNFVGKLAAINIFHIAGDLILGAGIASTSLGIDGLSQSISTTSSATNAGYGARVTGYLEDLKVGLKKLESKYRRLPLTSL